MAFDPSKFDPSKIDPTKHAFSFLEEFKKFAFKGNMIDMAVAIVVGGAFAKLVESLVKNIIMPLVSTVMPASGGYKEWKPVLNGVPIPVGEFLGEIVSFLIVAFAVFVFMVKILGLLMKKKEEPAAPAPPTPTEALLTEIRDLLKSPASGGR